MPPTRHQYYKKKNPFIYAIAAKKRDDKIILVEARGDEKHAVSKDILEYHAIHLGDYCSFILNEINNPVSLRKQQFFNKDIETRVENDQVTILNVTATMSINNGVKFYNSPEFGKLACLDRSNENFGKSLINIRLLEEDERVGVYSRYLWGGTSSLKKNKEIEENNIVNLSSLAIEENEDSESENEDDEIQKRVIGMVLEKLNDNKFVIWTSESFVGTNGVLTCEKPPFPASGDWVSLIFSNDEYARFFPKKKSSATPRFETREFRMIPALHDTRSLPKKGIQIMVDISVGTDHVAGNDIHDPILGVLSDHQMKVPSGSGNYRITVRHSSLMISRSGKSTVFEIVQAQKNNFKVKGTPVKQTQKNDITEPKTTKKEENVKIAVDKSVKIDNEQEQISEKKINKGKVVFPLTETKRAVVTSMTRSPVDKRVREAFLWLIDEHQCSKLYVKEQYDRFLPGNFFEGVFSKKNEKANWQCDRPLRPLERLMNSTYEGHIEFIVAVNKYFPPGVGGNNRECAETCHQYFGRIVDNKLKLPAICAHRVTIKTKQVKIDGKYQWVVSDLKETEEQQLINSFADVWNIPPVRKIIGIKYSDEFNKIKHFFDNKQTE